ncbi:hypothetical protein LIER_20691 [Lithospermum erythrorhizon]|uniref:Aminotransferase-like plant mobile domain-containing protein n=1 Tax=Lithospermum erythrorhizon TaxID=34254 RepID=A0AAV3QPU9_LITER
MASRADAWIYEYFLLFQRGMAAGGNMDPPRAKRWSNITTTHMDPKSTISYQKQLDKLTPTDVRWTPFGPIPDDLVSYYHGYIRFLSFNEEYMTDRVTWQFGRVQDWHELRSIILPVLDVDGPEEFVDVVQKVNVLLLRQGL